MGASPAARTLEADAQPFDAKRFDGRNRRRLSGPGLRTFVAISDLWRLSEAERLLILGSPARSTYQNWTKSVREHRDIVLSVDELTRISLILGIHAALMILHKSEADALAWLRTPHGGQVFGGQRPLDLIISGTQDGLHSVRRFLDAARGGIYMEPNALDRDSQPYTDADIVLR